MTTLGKRALIKMIGLSAVSMAVLTACGKKEEAPAAPAAAPAAAAPAADKLKIGFMYVSPIGDGGWTYQHELGRKAMADSNLKCNTCNQVRFADVITSFVLVLSTTSA